MKKSIKKIILLLLLAAISILVFACNNSVSNETNNQVETEKNEEVKQTRTIVDMKGVEVEIPLHVNTYVESWFAHNAVDLMLNDAKGMLVTCCDEPSYKWMYLVCENMKNAEYMAFSDNMSLEEIISLNPDVVFGSNEKYREMFLNVGIPFVNCTFNTYDTMKKSINLTAEILGDEAKAIAAKYIDYLDRKLQEVKSVTDTVDEDKRTTIVHGSSVYTLGVDGKNTIIDEWINYSGGVNAAAEDIDGNLKTMTLEQLLLWDPDVIITGSEQSEVDSIMSDDKWSSLKAVKNNRVYANPKGVFAWDRYGVEEALQFQYCSQLLYPELFKDFDLKSELKYFYKEFFKFDLSDEQADKILRHENP